MNTNAFRITFRGEVIQGWELDKVKVNLARLFNLDLNNQQHIQKIERMFSGRLVVIKDGIDKNTAQAYADAIAKAGGQAYIKIKIGSPNGIAERRSAPRRMRIDRRKTSRPSAILPDRRTNRGRRETDPNE